MLGIIAPVRDMILADVRVSLLIAGIVCVVVAVNFVLVMLSVQADRRR